MIGTSGGLSDITQLAGESAADARVTDPATESPEVLGMAVAGEQEAKPGMAQAAEEPMAHLAQPAGEVATINKAAEPATGYAELLGVAGAGKKGPHSGAIEDGREAQG